MPATYWRKTPHGQDSLYSKLIKSSNPCGEVILQGIKECTLGENEMASLDDYVVYLKGRDTSKLGQNKKDIWKIVEVDSNYGDGNTVTLHSISKERTFETDIDNIVSIKTLNKKGLFNREYFVEKAFNLIDNIYFTESKKVNSINSNKNMVKRTVDSNMDAAKIAATIAAGRTLNSVVTKQLVDRKVVPIMVRGYVDTAFGAVVIANIADFAVKQFNVTNPKARLATEAMMQAAMVDLLGEVDFDGIINDVLANVNLGDLTAD